ncbi:hypothetical protein DPMN_130981 [Dreissena polymorpha]|uniref:Uncharacterized protein n=1 Tax=Dreissena polymorpha TaxID=45954 RepID=A0A9D4K238_DREPO|nr:hypothetical protein DPMN_130981 [Dreissena polymorpha]
MFHDLELNGQLSSATRMTGAVVFATNENGVSTTCHGVQTRVKETCILNLVMISGMYFSLYFIMRLQDRR